MTKMAVGGWRHCREAHVAHILDGSVSHRTAVIAGTDPQGVVGANRDTGGRATKALSRVERRRGEDGGA